MSSLCRGGRIRPPRAAKRRAPLANAYFGGGVLNAGSLDTVTAVILVT
jgi:hypothetical protein